MKQIDATPGECLYNFLVRVQYENREDVEAIHNETSVIVRPGSNIDDLCIIWDLKRRLGKDL